jgi:pilus assembly protein Flp/PilA
MRREAKKLLKLAKRFFCEEEGQGMAEYGLILALIAVAVIAVLGLMGDGLKDIFNEVKEKLVVPAG